MKFIQLLQGEFDIDCEVIIGDRLMPTSIVWSGQSKVTDYAIRKYNELLSSKILVTEKGIEVICANYKLGELFCLAIAGYIGNSEYERSFNIDI